MRHISANNLKLRAPLDARERKARAFESHRGFLPCI